MAFSRDDVSGVSSASGAASGGAGSSVVATVDRRYSRTELLNQFEAYKFEFKKNPGWGDLTGQAKETRWGGWRSLHRAHHYFSAYTDKQDVQIRAHKEAITDAFIAPINHDFNLLSLNFDGVERRLSLGFAVPEHSDGGVSLPLLPVPEVILNAIPKELFVAEALGVGSVESTYSYKDNKLSLSIGFRSKDRPEEKIDLTTFNYSLPRREYFNMAEDIWHHWFGGAYPNGTGTTPRPTYHRWDGRRGDDHYANDPIEATFEPQQNNINEAELSRALETRSFIDGMVLINALKQIQIDRLRAEMLSVSGLTTASAVAAGGIAATAATFASHAAAVEGILAPSAAASGGASGGTAAIAETKDADVAPSP